MPNQHSSSISKNLILAFCGAGLCTSCALSPALNPDTSNDDFEVGGSFLKIEKNKANTTESQDESRQSNSPKMQYQEAKISSMASLSEGSPLLTKVPQFASNKPIKVALNEMELPQLVQYVFGDLLNLDYVMASDVERMRDRTALNIQTEVTAAQLYEITSNILQQHQVQLYSKDNIVYVDKSRSGSSNRSVGIGASIKDMPSSGDNIVQLVPYTYNSSRSIINMLQKLTDAKAYPDTDNRLLVVEGSRADVERALQVVGMLDVPSARGRDIRMMTLAFITPDELINQLTNLIEAEGLRIGEDVAMVPLNRLNAVVVYAGSSKLGQRVSMWARKLDVPGSGESERFYVYRPQFAKAVDLAKSLMSLFGASDAATTSANESDKAKGASKNAGKLLITADETQNALIIHATLNRYNEVMDLLEQLDRLPGQVALQVVVAEVTLGDNDKRGLDWDYNEGGIDGGDMAKLTLSGTGSAALSMVRGDWQATLNLIAQRNDTRILSRPYLVVRDGESATINSGTQIPIQTETTSSDANPDVQRTSVQYRSTGINLSVTPTINADGLVSLDISQETSRTPAKNDDTGQVTTLTPAITNRSITTSVFAGNGQTVVLGGLIQEENTVTDGKVPILGDIPLLGSLFQTKARDKSRTELVVLITPRIIKNTTDLDDFGKKLSELYSFPINE